MRETRKLCANSLFGNALLQVLFFIAHPIVNGLEVQYREVHNLGYAEAFSTLGTSITTAQVIGLIIAAICGIALVILTLENDS